MVASKPPRDDPHAVQDDPEVLGLTVDVVEHAARNGQVEQVGAREGASTTTPSGVHRCGIGIPAAERRLPADTATS
ncbi:MAG: hypothetical protein R2713_08180 [Ilumatobacteraceae bacterium]